AGLLDGRGDGDVRHGAADLRPLEMLPVGLEPQDLAAVGDADLPARGRGQVAGELELAPQRDGEVHHVVAVPGLMPGQPSPGRPAGHRLSLAARPGRRLRDGLPVRYPGFRADVSGRPGRQGCTGAEALDLRLPGRGRYPVIRLGDRSLLRAVDQ